MLLLLDIFPFARTSTLKCAVTLAAGCTIATRRERERPL